MNMARRVLTAVTLQCSALQCSGIIPPRPVTVEERGSSWQDPE